MQVEIDPKDLVQKQTDSRGRLTLGTEYADEEVKVLVLDD